MFVSAILLTLRPNLEPITQGALFAGSKGLTSIEVEIGHQRLRLLIDTGADRTILTPQAYRRVTGRGIPEAERSSGVESAFDVEVRAGGTALGRLRIVGWNLRVLEQPIDGLKVDGLLGRDLLSRHVWSIDYLMRRYRVFAPNTPTENLGRTYSAYGRMYRPRRGGDEEDGYTVSASSGNWRGWMQLDTGASYSSLRQDAATKIPHMRAGSRDMTGPFGIARRDVVLLPQLDAGCQLLFPKLTLSDREGIGDGVISPFALDLWALALLPTGHVAFWRSSDEDVHLTSAFRRLADLPLTVRKSRLYVIDQRSGIPGREREVIALKGKPADYWLRLMKSSQATSWSELLGLIRDARDHRTVEIRGDNGVERLELQPERD